MQGTGTQPSGLDPSMFPAREQGGKCKNGGDKIIVSRAKMPGGGEQGGAEGRNQTLENRERLQERMELVCLRNASTRLLEWR